MSPRGAERALRRAVADLARLHPDDVEAVFGALDADQKARLDRLIAGEPDAPAEAAEPAAPVRRYQGVSPWLLDRLDDSADARTGRDFVLMTPASSRALRAAAEPFRSEDGTDGGRRGPTLLSRGLAFIKGPRP